MTYVSTRVFLVLYLALVVLEIHSGYLHDLSFIGRMAHFQWKFGGITELLDATF